MYFALKPLALSLIAFLLYSPLNASTEPPKIRAAFDVGSGATKMKVFEVKTVNGKYITTAVDPDNCSADRAVKYKEDLNKELGVALEEAGNLYFDNPALLAQTKLEIKKDFKDRGIENTIKEDTMYQGIEALKELKQLAISCGAQEFSGVATSAFRQADNSKSIIAALTISTGIYLNIVSQLEEADLGFNGLIAKKKIDPRGVCSWDIGGSSMQIVCMDQSGEKFYHLSTLASVPFKDIMVQHRVEQESNQDQRTKILTENTPNPISIEAAEKANIAIEGELSRIKSGVAVLSVNRVYGIGGVHYYSVNKNNSLPKYTTASLGHAIERKLNKTDGDLGGGKYVNTDVSNMILVHSIMQQTGISEVEAARVNLTEGLSISEKYW
ncbi:MAG: Ppx/GppA phosphatase family protein [Bdellovibrionales bacterium]